MAQYKHTQVGYSVLAATVVVGMLFTWANMSAHVEAPSADSGTNLAVTTAMALAIFILASFSTLTTSVDEQYLQIQFGLGIFKKCFELKEIVSVDVVRNRWYYGWGIKVWFWPYMWIYNISGLNAVEIRMKNGKRYRVGTDMPQELEAAIKKAVMM